MLGFCPLASGSRGNVVFFGTKEVRLLIDAGISMAALQKRLSEIDVDLDTIEAILVTHEHTDHIQGIAKLSEKYRIPIFANAATAKGICAVLGMRPRFKIFATGEPFQFGDLEIVPFGVPHDTLDPVAFTIRTARYKIGFCTDLGYVTSLVKKRLEGCDYLYLEANHQPSMVHACNRPPIYKQRVLSRQGHLSNEQCRDLLASLVHKDLRHVHLAHLSSECNAEEVVLHTMSGVAGGIELSIAYQECISRAVIF